MTIQDWTPNALKQCLSSKPMEGYPTNSVLIHMLPQLIEGGFWLEFGVAGGKSITFISKEADKRKDRPRVVGFDSFEGLPEIWKPWTKKGAFKQDKIPDVPGAEFVVGLFSDTLIPWINNQKDIVVTFAHIDCDLYVGAKQALLNIAPFFVNGTIVVFDELVRYKGFEDHEWKALYECSVEEKLFDFKWIAHQESKGRIGEEVAIEIIK